MHFTAKFFYLRRYQFEGNIKPLLTQFVIFPFYVFLDEHLNFSFRFPMSGVTLAIQRLVMTATRPNESVLVVSGHSANRHFSNRHFANRHFINRHFAKRLC